MVTLSNGRGAKKFSNHPGRNSAKIEKVPHDARFKTRAIFTTCLYGFKALYLQILSHI